MQPYPPACFQSRSLSIAPVTRNGVGFSTTEDFRQHLGDALSALAPVEAPDLPPGVLFSGLELHVPRTYAQKKVETAIDTLWRALGITWAGPGMRNRGVNREVAKPS